MCLNLIHTQITDNKSVNDSNCFNYCCCWFFFPEEAEIMQINDVHEVTHPDDAGALMTSLKTCRRDTRRMNECKTQRSYC